MRLLVAREIAGRCVLLAALGARVLCFRVDWRRLARDFPLAAAVADKERLIRVRNRTIGRNACAIQLVLIILYVNIGIIIVFVLNHLT